MTSKTTSSSSSNMILKLAELWKEKYPKENEKLNQDQIKIISSNLSKIYEISSIQIITKNFTKEEKFIDYLENISLENLIHLYILSQNKKDLSSILHERNEFKRIPTDEISISFSNWNTFFKSSFENTKQPKEYCIKKMKEFIQNFNYGVAYDVIFYLASHEDLFEILKFFIEEKIFDLNECFDAYGNTPLHFSELFKNEKISKFLRENMKKIDEEDLKEFLSKHSGSKNVLNLKD